MNDLVRLKLADRSANPKDGIVFIAQRILPTLELCKKLEGDKKMVAGGRLSGAIALSWIVNAESVQERDALITSLPVRPLMETTLTPFTCDVRMQAVQARLDQMKNQGGAR